MIQQWGQETAEAVAAVEAGANPLWLAAAEKAIRIVATAMPEFTSDDVNQVLSTFNPPETRSKRAMGPVLVRLAKDNVIVRTNRVRNSSRDELHNQRLSVWESLIYKP